MVGEGGGGACGGGQVEKVDEVVHVPVPLLEVPVPVPEVLVFEVPVPEVLVFEVPVSVFEVLVFEEPVPVPELEVHTCGGRGGRSSSRGIFGRVRLGHWTWALEVG